jgi:peptidoglycan/xylan/chitin deacetylase (PgdA/CDA1 family)
MAYHHTVTSAIERLLLPLLCRSPLDRVGRRANRAKAVIGMYHGFTARDAHDGIENHEQKHLHIRAFTAQLEFLKAHYRVIPLDELIRALASGGPLPERAAVITIDDGYRSIYTVAYPALKAFQLPAAVFLATEFVDGRKWLWTDRVEYAVSHAAREAFDLTIGAERLRVELKDRPSQMAADRLLRSKLKALQQEMRDDAVSALEAAAGARLNSPIHNAELYEPLHWHETAEMVASGLVSIGSHTHTHVIMSRCAPDRAAEELRQSRKIIEDRLGRPCTLFCYPNGRRGDFNGATSQLLKDQGFAGALTTVYGMNGPAADPFELHRYNLGKPMIPGELEVRLSGLLELGS